MLVWVSVGRLSHLGHTLAHRIRVMGGCCQVCDLGVTGTPLIFGLARGSGAFTGGLLTFDLVSGFHLE